MTGHSNSCDSGSVHPTEASCTYVQEEGRAPRAVETPQTLARDLRHLCWPLVPPQWKAVLGALASVQGLQFLQPHVSPLLPILSGETADLEGLAHQNLLLLIPDHIQDLKTFPELGLLPRTRSCAGRRVLNTHSLGVGSLGEALVITGGSGGA
jgi:hypothetical protein